MAHNTILPTSKRLCAMEVWDGTDWLCTGQLGGTKSGGSARQAQTVRQDLSGETQRHHGNAATPGGVSGICAGRGYVGRDPPGPAGPFDASSLPNCGGAAAEAGSSARVRDRRGTRLNSSNV